jgi:nitrogen fixation NifU-like protein
MSSALDDMYREVIMDHYKAPRGKKPIHRHDISSGGHNPACGDEITVQAEIEDGILKDIHVDCRGCAISVASGSMLAEIVKGRSFEEIEEIADVVKRMLTGELDELPEEYGDIDALKGVRQFPVRVKCALLSWVTLVEGIRQYGEGKNGGAVTVSTEDEGDANPDPSARGDL